MRKALAVVLAASGALFAGPDALGPPHDRRGKSYRAELKQARLSAHLLNISACRSIAPK